MGSRASSRRDLNPYYNDQNNELSALINAATSQAQRPPSAKPEPPLPIKGEDQFVVKEQELYLKLNHDPSDQYFGND